MTAGERSLLLVGNALADLGGADPTHRVIHVRGSTITWTGSDPADAPPAGEVIDLGGAWLTPGFVDAHVHATATGLQAGALDLTGAGSVAEVLDAVRRHAAASSSPVVFGAGWDDMSWPEGRPPTAGELAGAAPGRTVLLVRVDGHSCVVDAGLLAGLDLADAPPGTVVVDPDGSPTGWLKEQASGIAQAEASRRRPAAETAAAREAFCRRALALGITAVHEMGVPAISDHADALAWATGEWPIDVTTYWAALAVDPTGVLRPGGDLFLDGSIGSCTAATTSPYADGRGGTATGVLFHPDDAVADFFVAATRAGVGGGVHAIGDRAIRQAVEAIAIAAEVCGVDAVRAARHRIEHLEMVPGDLLPQMAHLGVAASVQPAFDAVWNGPDGLYERRFGRAVADATNPLAALHRAGVPMCFSSDSPVTPLDPWGGVLAAQAHHGGAVLDRRTALAAATIGGHAVVGRAEAVGALRPGHRADVVAWPGDPLGDDPRGWTPVAVMAAGTLHDHPDGA